MIRDSVKNETETNVDEVWCKKDDNKKKIGYVEQGINRTATHDGDTGNIFQEFT